MSDAKGFIDFNHLDNMAADPAVDALVKGGRQREGERHLTRRERQKKLKEREKAAKRKGARALYDLPPDLIKAVQALAEQHRTTASQVAALALTLFLAEVEAGAVDLYDYRVPSDSFRYDYKILLTKNR